MKVQGLLLSGTVVGENPDHVCWVVFLKKLIYLQIVLCLQIFVPRRNLLRKGDIELPSVPVNTGVFGYVGS